MLAGDRAALLGREDTGPREVLLHPLRAVSALSSSLPPAHRVELATGGAHRHLRAGGEAVVESALVLPRLPGVVLRWSREGAGEGAPPLELRLEWRTPTASGPGLVGPDPGPSGSGAGPDAGSVLRLPLVGEAGALVVALLGGEGRWSVAGGNDSSEPGLRVELRADLAPRTPLAVAFATDRDDGTGAGEVLRRVGRPDAVVRAWAGAERRAGEDELALDAGDRGLGPALAWARRRLAASVIHPGGRRPGRIVAGYGPGCSPRAGRGAPEEPDGAGDAAPEAPRLEAIWTGHGLLAAGRHREALEVAARLLDRLPGAARGGETALTSSSAGPLAPLTLHFVATAALWTGDAHVLHEGREAVEEALERLATEPVPVAPDGAAVATAAAFRELADAVEAGGDPDRAATLRSTWESLREGLSVRADGGRGTGPAGQGARSLPVVPGPEDGEDGEGAAPAGSGRDGLVPDPAVLAAVLRVPGPPPAPPRGPPRPAAGGRAGLRAWARWERGDPEAALEEWTALLRRGAGEGRGLWPLHPEEGGEERSPCPWHSATTGLVVAPLVFGLLGARADAEYGRLRLAPRVPAGWERFEVRGLRAGDVRVRIAYRREGLRHTFVLAPTRGRIPLNVVFEPLLPTAAIRGAEVDGEEADLDAHRRGDRTGIRLQLPLDSRRVITVDGAGEHDG